MDTPVKQSHPTALIRDGVPTPPEDTETKTFPGNESPTPAYRPKTRHVSEGNSLFGRQPASAKSTTSRSRTPSSSKKNNKSSNESRDEAAKAYPRERQRSPATASLPTKLSVEKRPNKTPRCQRSASSSAILSTPKTPEELAEDTSLYINTQLEKRILTPLRKTVTGNNYILEAEIDGKSIIKIGLTKKAAYDRLNEIQSVCKRTQISVKEPGLRKIAHVKTAEKLIQKELEHFQHKFTCKGCRVEHGEYFAIDLEFARQVTERWTSFCASEPWNEHGELHPFWKRRLEHTMSASRFLTDHDHESRAKLWQAFVSPSVLDRVAFNAASVFSAAQPRFWQWLSLVQAFYTFCNLPGRGTLVMLLSLMAFMLVERDFWPNLAPWSCAFEKFVPPRNSASKMPPSPVPGDFAITVQDHDADSSTNGPRDKKEPSPDKETEQVEEIKPSAEVVIIESSGGEHDTSDDEPNSINTPTRAPNKK